MDNDYQNMSVGSLTAGSGVSQDCISVDLSSAMTNNLWHTAPQSGQTFTIAPGGMAGVNPVWTTNTTAGWNGTSAMDLNSSGNLKLQGENADIDINGKSLMKTLTALEERLNWLEPNPELEKEWEELRDLGNRYRELEIKCKEKSKMWTKLKSMPPPDQL